MNIINNRLLYTFLLLISKSEIYCAAHSSASLLSTYEAPKISSDTESKDNLRSESRKIYEEIPGISNEIIQMLRSYAHNNYLEGLGRYLIDAIKNKNIKLVRELIRLGADVNIKVPYEYSKPMLNWDVLGYAISLGNFTIVKLLIDAGANVNVQYSYGSSPLEDAIVWKRLFPGEYPQIINLLQITQKAPDYNDLLFAIKSNNIKNLQNLINLGAGVNTNRISKTAGELIPLLMSTQNPEIVKILLKAGIDVNSRRYNNYTALMQAIDLDNEAIVKLLLNAGADLDFRHNNETALDKALKRKNENIIKLIRNEPELRKFKKTRKENIAASVVNAPSVIIDLIDSYLPQEQEKIEQYEIETARQESQEAACKKIVTNAE